MRCILIAALTALLPLLAHAGGVAILPVKLLDTSHEPRNQEAEHQRRLTLLAEVLTAELDGAVIIGAGEVQSCQPETTACLLGLARSHGADRALFIVAQKTSTLILQLFANLVDVETGDLVVSRNLNFRGDNDDSWRRAGRFLSRQIRDASP